jgi:hypothetical protein
MIEAARRNQSALSLDNTSLLVMEGNDLRFDTAENEQFSKAIEVCKKAFKPLVGHFQEIGVMEFRPIKHIACWSFGSYSH